MATKLFPTIQMLICLAASGVYVFHGDWRKALYWLAAATITFTVTY